MEKTEVQQDIPQLIEHFFRYESGKLTSVITKMVGTGNIALAEDIVQDSLIKAMHHWSYGQVPDNPSAWIMRTAKNLAIDHLRRDTNFRNKQGEVVEMFLHNAKEETNNDILLNEEIADDQLRMIFVCCHPANPKDSQIALALKILCGFSVGEIARAFLINEETIAKRLTRAKQKIRDENVAFEIPSGNALSKRLEAVHEVIYLLFNEGYNATHGNQIIRKDLCEEAIRLAYLLLENTRTETPNTKALLSLMLFHFARMNARVDENGNIILLENQDRKLWNKEMIGVANKYLNLSSEKGLTSDYHLQAGIVAMHCLAKSYSETNWAVILGLYDQLMQINPSPVVALNRVVALSKVEGATQGLSELSQLENLKQMSSYYLFYSIKADLLGELGQSIASKEAYQKAISLTNIESEKELLRRKMAN